MSVSTDEARLAAYTFTRPEGLLAHYPGSFTSRRPSGRRRDRKRSAGGVMGSAAVGLAMGAV
jgi:hypothetical protein